MARVLIIDDEPKIGKILAVGLRPEGHNVTTVTRGRAGLDRLHIESFDLILCDLRMPDMDGIQVLTEAKRIAPRTDFVMMTAYASVANAVEAIKRGAQEYLVKPFDMEEVRHLVHRIEERRRLLDENATMHSRHPFGNILGRAAPMQKVLEMVRQVAPRDTSVLIRGESGTGKELIARALHHHSPRAAGPLVVVHCAAIPETLLETELFGHRKGAFTGADEDRKGRFEVAHRGTIFLDEIGEIPHGVQVKLLRFLQDREVLPVGANDAVHIDVRVIAATNADLEGQIRSGHFREDLFYRLNVFPIVVPPLREHPEDIQELALHFLSRQGISPDHVAPAYLQALREYSWPGNVRELENLVERSAIMAEGKRLEAAHLPALCLSPREVLEDEDGPRAPGLDEEEYRRIAAALIEAEGNKAKAARLLGITRRRLYSRLEALERRLGRKPADGT